MRKEAGLLFVLALLVVVAAPALGEVPSPVVVNGQGLVEIRHGPPVDDSDLDPDNWVFEVDIARVAFAATTTNEGVDGNGTMNIRTVDPVEAHWRISGRVVCVANWGVALGDQIHEVRFEVTRSEGPQSPLGNVGDIGSLYVKDGSASDEFGWLEGLAGTEPTCEAHPEVLWLIDPMVNGHINVKSPMN